MDKQRKFLPPLDTLVFFEAALRAVSWAVSFCASATELYISQAAVSKRVKQLENWLGVDLFQRGVRSLEPTHAGGLAGRSCGHGAGLPSYRAPCGQIADFIDHSYRRKFCRVRVLAIQTSEVLRAQPCVLSDRNRHQG